MKKVLLLIAFMTLIVPNCLATIYWMEDGDLWSSSGPVAYDLSEGDDRFYDKVDGGFIYGDNEVLFDSDNGDMYFLDDLEEE